MKIANVLSIETGTIELCTITKGGYLSQEETNNGKLYEGLFIKTICCCYVSLVCSSVASVHCLLSREIKIPHDSYYSFLIT